MGELDDFFPAIRQPLDWIQPGPEDYLNLAERIPLEPAFAIQLGVEEFLGEEMFDSYAAYESIFPQRNFTLEVPTLCEKKPPLFRETLFPRRQGKPQLSSPKDGKPNRAQQRHLAEIAQQLADSGRFRNIDGRLYHFCTPCWRLRLAEEAGEFLPGIVRRIFPEYADCISMRNYREIFEQLRSRVERESMTDMTQDNQQYLCCKDGVYRLSDGVILPPDPGLNLFYHLNLSAYEIGQGDGYYTEIFLRNATGGDIALRERILQMVAVIITAMPLKCFFFLEGKGNTGKSQFIKFLEGLLGAGACCSLSSINILADRWTLGGLVDKLMCSCPDIPNDLLSAKAIGCIKQIAGDDRLRGELKGVDPSSFDCNAKLVFGSNHPLKIAKPEREEAFLKRMVWIPFHNPIPKDAQIQQLYQYLINEAGYIVALAMEQRHKLIANDYTFAGETLEGEAYIRPTDEQSLLSFLENCCEREPSAKTSANDLYLAFCNSEQGKYDRIDRSRFGRLLSQLCPELKSERTSTTRYWRGIRIRKDNPDAVADIS